MTPRPPPPILFQDSRFIVIDKPAGLPAHPGRAGGPSVEDWFDLWSRRRDGPWLVHRLDTDTAGCLVIALRKVALVRAQAAFASGRVTKTYWAVVTGVPQAASGTIDAPLLRRDDATGWRVVTDPHGQPAVTVWRLLGSDGKRSWLALSPKTGRTHQVRVHCAAMGCPILGDAHYGGGGGPMHLLARAIRLDLDPFVAAVAEPPPAMHEALRACGWTGVSDRFGH